jgi:hypothetical protein
MLTGKNRFDKNSLRCRMGFKFQQNVLSEISQVVQATDTRGWFSKNNPKLNSYELNKLEQEYGDIVAMVGNRLVFVECVSINHENNSPFPESKIKRFVGENKWYAVGWESYGPKFIHSRTLNAYAKHLPKFCREGRDFRWIRRQNIRGIKKGCIGASKFVKLIR